MKKNRIPTQVALALMLPLLLTSAHETAAAKKKNASSPVIKKYKKKKAPTDTPRSEPKSLDLGSEAPSSMDRNDLPPVSVNPAPVSSSSQYSIKETHTSSTSHSSSQATTLSFDFMAPTPIYITGQTFYSGWGVMAELNEPLFNENGLTFHLSGAYQQFDIRTLKDVRLKQFELMGGVELMSPQKVLWFKPFIGGDLGTAYNYLSFAKYDSVQNAAFSFAARVRPGILLPVTDSISAQFTLPFTGYIYKGSLYTLSAFFGVRFEI